MKNHSTPNYFQVIERWHPYMDYIRIRLLIQNLKEFILCLFFDFIAKLIINILNLLDHNILAPLSNGQFRTTYYCYVNIILVFIQFFNVLLSATKWRLKIVFIYYYICKFVIWKKDFLIFHETTLFNYEKNRVFPKGYNFSVSA